MLIETPTTTLATPTASCERPAEVWRHQSPNQQRALSTPSATIKCKYPSLPNPSIYSLNIRARRGGGEAVCAPWGRWCFAPQPLLGPCHDRRCRASSVHSHFHSPHRVPSPNPPRTSPPQAACSIKRHARGGAQYAPQVERAVQAPRRVRGSLCIFAADLASTRALVRRHSKI